MGELNDKNLLIQVLEVFQKRYAEAQLQIRQLEIELIKLAQSGVHNPSELKELQLKLDALIHREKSWITKIKRITSQLKKKAS